MKSIENEIHKIAKKNLEDENTAVDIEDHSICWYEKYHRDIEEFVKSIGGKQTKWISTEEIIGYANEKKKPIYIILDSIPITGRVGKYQIYCI